MSIKQLFTYNLSSQLLFEVYQAHQSLEMLLSAFSAILLKVSLFLLIKLSTLLSLQDQDLAFQCQMPIHYVSLARYRPILMLHLFLMTINHLILLFLNYPLVFIFLFLNFLFIILKLLIPLLFLRQFLSPYLRVHFKDTLNPQPSLKDPFHAPITFSQIHNIFSLKTLFDPLSLPPIISNFLSLQQFFRFLITYLSLLHLSYLTQSLSIISIFLTILFNFITLNLFTTSTLISNLT